MTTTETEMMESMRDVMAEAGFDDDGTFEENGVMTRDTGFVVKTADGAEFHVTVQRTRA